MSNYLQRPPSKKGIGIFKVPMVLARVIPVDAKFDAELTDEGILFRFVGIVAREDNVRTAASPDAPAWARNGAS